MLARCCCKKKNLKDEMRRNATWHFRRLYLTHRHSVMFLFSFDFVDCLTFVLLICFSPVLCSMLLLLLLFLLEEPIDPSGV